MDDRDKRRLACTPGDYERIRDAAAATGVDQFFTVVSSPAVPPGMVIVMQSEAEFDADLQRVGEELHADLSARLRQRCEEDEAELRERMRRDAAARLIYATGPRSWPSKSWLGVVTGL